MASIELVIGGLIGFFSAMIIAVYKDKKEQERFEERLEAENKRIEKQLEQGTKNLYLQLVYDDRKKFLQYVYSKLKSIEESNKTSEIKELKEKIEGVNGEFLPENIKNELLKELNGYLHFVMVSNPIYDPYEEEYYDELYEEHMVQQYSPDPFFQYEKDCQAKLRKIVKTCKKLAGKGIIDDNI